MARKIIHVNHVICKLACGALVLSGENRPRRFGNPAYIQVRAKREIFFSVWSFILEVRIQDEAEVFKLAQEIPPRGLISALPGPESSRRRTPEAGDSELRPCARPWRLCTAVLETSSGRTPTAPDAARTPRSTHCVAPQAGASDLKLLEARVSARLPALHQQSHGPCQRLAHGTKVTARMR